MSRDIDAPVDCDSGAAIRLREDRFELLTSAVGAKSDTARAELIGVDRRTIRRVRDGVVGETFMAQAVAALRKRSGADVTLDDLFQVVEEPARTAGLVVIA